MAVTSLDPHVSIWRGLGIEALLTFILVFAMFATIDPNRKELGSKALAVGVAVAMCHMTGYRFTMSSMNPARSLGPAFVMNKWTHHWVYWVGPLLGGVLSGLLYEYIFDPSRSRKRTRSVEDSPSYPDLEEESTQAQTTSSSPVHTQHTYGNQASWHHDNSQWASCNNHISGHHGNHLHKTYGNNFHCNTENEVGTNYGGSRRAYKSYMPVDVTNSGNENEAYSFDSHPRRIPPPPPPRNMHNGEAVRGEEILLDDVKVDTYPARQIE